MFKVININTPQIINSSSKDLYQYTVFVGSHKVSTKATSSYWYLDSDKAYCLSGDGTELLSELMCVEIIGYTPENRTSTYSKGTDLPYINGCSTKQLIPSVRAGDPTFQMLYMPPYTSEQAHHIHATPRIVYVAKGSGTSIVGNSSKNKKYKLKKGDILILEKMVPHHFETHKNELLVLPLHIFSSIGSEEFNHPMFNGTHKV